MAVRSIPTSFKGITAFCGQAQASPTNGGKLQTVSVSGRFRSNSAAAIRAAASEGLGLAQLPLWQIREFVDEGTLAIVLSEFETEGMPVQLVWPPTRAPLERMRRFVDFLANGLKTDLI